MSGRALATNHTLSLEVTDLSNRRTGNKVIRATIHHAAENPGSFGIQKVLQGSSPDDQRDLRRAALKPAITLFRSLNMVPRYVQPMLLINTSLDAKIT